MKPKRLDRNGIPILDTPEEIRKRGQVRRCLPDEHRYEEVPGSRQLDFSRGAIGRLECKYCGMPITRYDTWEGSWEE
jgi:hypothetical protein